MLDEARRRAAKAGCPEVRWMEGTAEELDRLGLGPCRVVTFGQSFHRTDRPRAAEAAYNVLEPGGAIVLVSHAYVDRPQPPNPGAPLIPPDHIHQLIASYLGPFSVPDVRIERWEDSLGQSSFGSPRVVYVPGVPDYVRDEDSVVANYFSMSFSAPPLFGARREAFEADLRALLRAHSPQRRFWDWPGDTEFVIGRRRQPGAAAGTGGALRRPGSPARPCRVTGERPVP
jgi:hypothetical protein